jgi:hypothetical protein
MLSNAVKYRRRLNRMLRRQPKWRIVMRLLKFQQEALVKMTFNSAYGARSSFAPSADPDAVSKYFGTMHKLKHDRRHMTRLEFIAEVRHSHEAAGKTISDTEIQSMLRQQALSICQGYLDREIVDKKEKRRHRK